MPRGSRISSFSISPAPHPRPPPVHSGGIGGYENSVGTEERESGSETKGDVSDTSEEKRVIRGRRKGCTCTSMCNVYMYMRILVRVRVEYVQPYTLVAYIYACRMRR